MNRQYTRDDFVRPQALAVGPQHLDQACSGVEQGDVGGSGAALERGVRNAVLGVELQHLPDLLGQGHPAQQVVDALLHGERGITVRVRSGHERAVQHPAPVLEGALELGDLVLDAGHEVRAAGADGSTAAVGALLYELLVGATPFDANIWRPSSALDPSAEMR